jgi:predicted nucleotidyltransferase
MKTLEEIKRILLEHKEEIRQKYGIIILGVFGSYARGEQKETSDIDIIVELDRPVGLDFYEFWEYIENLFGTKVDVLTLSALKQKTLLWENVKEDILILQKGVEE